jgi:hypothetical protein
MRRNSGENPYLKDMQNGIEDSDMNPHNYTHLIFDKDAKNIL